MCVRGGGGVCVCACACVRACVRVCVCVCVVLFCYSVCLCERMTERGVSMLCKVLQSTIHVD